MLNLNIVSTPHGPISLLPPSVELLRRMRQFLPLGGIRYAEPFHGADFGIVMKCGDREAWAIKQQPPDLAGEHTDVCLEANSILIAKALCQYLTNGFSGLLMPCAYFSKKANDTVEAGVAYFGAPSPEGMEALEFPHEPAFDNQFGHGFGTMLKHFIRALQQASRDTGITLQPTIGLNHRPRLKLGTLLFGFAVLGRNIICLKTKVSEHDPVWTVLRGDGITEVIHIPSIPSEISEDELPIAKPPQL